MKDLYKILIIDLENKSHYTKLIDKNISEFYMGGYALSLWWLNNHPNLKDPWMLFTSAIMRYKNTINRFSITSHALNYNITHSVMGGDFINTLKNNSYDAIILLNQAKSLTEIVIDKESVSFIEKNINKDNTNSKTYDYLKNKYGMRSSSIYITKSAMNNDYYGRVIEDKYRGIAKGLGHLLYLKNVISITVKENTDNLDEYESIYVFDESYRTCEGCITGCVRLRKDKEESIFDKKDYYSDFENQLSDEVNDKLDEYGIDKFALSKAITFAYDNLNDIYKIKSLDIEDLIPVVDQIINGERDKIYSYLTNGENYLMEKYSINLNFKENKKSDFKKYAKIMDSAGLCLFSTDAINLCKMATTINHVTGLSYTKDDLKTLSQKIEEMERQIN